MSPEVKKFLDSQRDAGSSGAAREKTRVNVSTPELENRLKAYGSQTEDFEITDEHRDAMIRIFQNHENVFITGGAGTGKTALINNVIIPELDHRGLMFGVCATTGIAGSHMGGRTVHSYLGIFPSTIRFSPMEPHPQDLTPERILKVYETSYDSWADNLATKPRIRTPLFKRLRSLEVLILDEVSQAAGVGLLGYIDFMLRRVREKDLPYGGVQLIHVGDFCQAPPVEKGEPRHAPDWAFLAPVWSDANVQTIELTKIFRQADREFAEFLNKVRMGDPVDPAYVQSFVRTLTMEEVPDYSFLVSHNAQCKDLNAQALGRFPAPTKSFPPNFVVLEQQMRWADDTVSKARSKLVGSRSHLWDSLDLRIGIPVLFTVNHSKGLYFNGTRGVIKGYGPPPDSSPQEGPPAAMREDDDKYCVYVEVPDKDKPSGTRLIYLPRFVYTRNDKEDRDEMMSVVIDGKQSLTHRYPVLKQFPLIPASSITLHKSQGMSLDRAIVHLDSVFAAGQAYVGMSRLRTARGLVLTSSNFEVKTDPHAVDFYRKVRQQKKII